MFHISYLRPSFSRRFFYGLALFVLSSAIVLAIGVARGPLSEPFAIEVEAAPFTAPAGTVAYDFDGDGKADIGRWHGTNTEFKVRHSSTGAYPTPSPLGTPSSKPAPGDFDGDDKFDPAVFNAGTWNIKPSGTPYQVSWGQSGDIPVVGDYDGDTISDIAIWRPSTTVWWIQKSTNGATLTKTFGQSTDIAMPGDYDGDGKTDYALWRPGDGTWYIEKNSGGSMGAQWGMAGDTPVHGDFDGDGQDDPAIFRPTTGTWYALKSSDNYASYTSQAWGNWGDQPVPADYDDDGKADLAIWRPTTGHWWIDRSSDTNVDTYLLGVPGDIAIPSSFTKQVGGTATADEL